MEANVRIITATNQNLKKRISKKKFREDLYWRINAISSTIPPLRKRKADIVPLAFHFLKLNNKTHTIQKFFAPEFLPLLLQYDWPGNVRELKNVIDRCYILSPGYTIYPDKLPKDISLLEDSYYESSPNDYDSIMDSFERQLIREVFKKEKTIASVQRELGLSQNKAYRLVKKYCRDLIEKY